MQILLTPADDPSEPLRLSWSYEQPSVDALRDGLPRVVGKTPCSTPRSGSGSARLRKEGRK